MAARFTTNPESVNAAARRPLSNIAITIAASLLASRHLECAVAHVSRFNSAAVMSSARTRHAGLNAASEVCTNARRVRGPNRKRRFGPHDLDGGNELARRDVSLTGARESCVVVLKMNQVLVMQLASSSSHVGAHARRRP